MNRDSLEKIRIRKFGEKWIVFWGVSASVEFPDMKSAFQSAKHLWELRGRGSVRAARQEVNP